MSNSFIQVPPDGSGKKLFAREHTVDGEIVHTQGMNVVSPSNPENIQEVDAQGQAFVRFINGSPEFDSFGRMSVAESKLMFSTTFNNGLINPFNIDTNVQGGATVGIDPAGSGGVLLSNDTVDGTISRIGTHRYFKYTPGFETSFVWTMAIGDQGKENVVRRAGAFDQTDGVFFEIDQNGLNIVVRNSITSTDIKIHQNSFNGDPLNGTGISGLTMDISKNHIYWIDYQWLGAGAIRFGTFANGNKIVMHTVGNFNNASIPYMFNGSKPFKVEQVNTGLVGSSSEMRLTCFSITTSASIDPQLNTRFKRLVTQNSVTTPDEVHIISIRPRQTDFNGNDNREALFLIRTELSAFMDQSAGIPNGLLRFTLIRDAEITGGTWESVDTDMEKNTTATVTGGVRTYSQLVKPDGNINLVVPPTDEKVSIVRKTDINEAQTFSLVVERIRGTEDYEIDATYIFSAG